MRSKVVQVVLFALVLNLSLGGVFAAEETAARKEFDAVFTKWKDLLSQMRTLQEEASLAEDSELPAMKERYASYVEEGESLIPQLRDTAIAVYKEQPNADRQISRWLMTIAKDYVERDDFDFAKPAVDALVEGKTDDPEIDSVAGVVAFCTNDFPRAKMHLQKASASGVLSQASQGMLAEVDNYVEFWKEEEALRKAAEEAPPGEELPLVSMKTSHGDLVIELFENEAPETVGNFVSLVEKGYYDGLTFHRVLPGFMAQGGCPDGTGSGGPGYEIYCECHQETHRKHFRGSLSMAHAGRDTGGSQFFLTFVPTAHLNGKHTVFGRVKEGLDVLPKLTRRDPTTPEGLAVTPAKILEAKVIRKRDHKYEPNKVR